MPSRAKQNVSGAIGELGVFSHFVRIGHAVNSLSHPGYGWNAQVHTTADVMDPGKLLASATAPNPPVGQLSRHL